MVAYTIRSTSGTEFTIYFADGPGADNDHIPSKWYFQLFNPTGVTDTPVLKPAPYDSAAAAEAAANDVVWGIPTDGILDAKPRTRKLPRSH